LNDQFEEVVFLQERRTKKRLTKYLAHQKKENSEAGMSLLLFHEDKVKDLQNDFKVLNFKDLYSTIEILH